MTSFGLITPTKPFYLMNQSKTISYDYNPFITSIPCKPINSLNFHGQFLIKAKKSKFSAFSVCSAIIKKEDDREGQNASSVFDFDAYLAKKVKMVNKALEQSIPVSKNNTLVRQAMRYSLLAGGKRIRPILCIAACEVIGGNPSNAMAGACMVEMVHTMSLIHDDLPSLDNDDLRRGKPTAHKAFGEKAAVLAGVSLAGLAVEYLITQSADLPAARVLAVVGEMGKCGEHLVVGQAADLLSTGKSDVTLEELEFIHAHKTGALLECSAAMGAMLGGGTEQEVQSLRKYGKCVGLLLQVVDDILDVTKLSEELGKTAGKDELAGKTTYVKLMGLDKAKEFADELTEEAKVHLSGFDHQKAAPLFALADYIAYRQN